jgi:hypothetical protein
MQCLVLSNIYRVFNIPSDVGIGNSTSGYNIMQCLMNLV